MNPRAILNRLDDERATCAAYGRVVQRLEDVMRFHAVDGSHHVVVLSQAPCNDAEVETLIDREIAHHRALGVAFELTVYGHHAPRDMVERLRRRGFHIGQEEAVMVCDASACRDWPADSSIRVRRADEEPTVADFRAVSEAVFKKDFAFTTNELLAAIRAGSFDHRGYVAYAPDGGPVSVGRLYTHPQSEFGGLFGGGTLAAFRGQGFYRATVAGRARDALARGAKYLRVDALPTSRPILERLGFQRLTSTWPCDWRSPMC